MNIYLYFGLVCSAVGLYFLVIQIRKEGFHYTSLIVPAIGLTMILHSLNIKEQHKKELNKRIILAPKLLFVIKNVNWISSEEGWISSSDGGMFYFEEKLSLKTGDTISVCKLSNVRFYLVTMHDKFVKIDVYQKVKDSFKQAINE